MKDLIITLLFTVVVIITSGMYFEYCVNRPFPIGLTLVLGMLLFLEFVLYIIFLIKLFIKHLNLKK